MKNCPLCHTSNDDDRELCSACGALLEGSIYENIKKKEYYEKNRGNKCSHCGKTYEENGLTIIEEPDGSYSHKSLCRKCSRNKTILQITLYFLVFTIWGMVTSVLRANGILLGALPTVIGFGVLILLARVIIKQIYEK